MAHNMIISRAENGFIVEVVGEGGGLFVTLNLKGLTALVSDYAQQLDAPDSGPDEKTATKPKTQVTPSEPESPDDDEEEAL